MGFKEKYSFDERQIESDRIINKYPHRLPIICEKSKLCKTGPFIDKNKYLVPDDFAFGQFSFVIRKRLKLPPEQAIFLFVQGTIPHSTQSINEIYKSQKDPDGFLYVSYSYENTFG
jgi:GABA(A) receptor-associated protein